jgi:glycosyltransferase involved in cell wall biosynthesis
VSKNIWVINQFAGTPTSGWGERHYYFSKNWLKEGYNVTIISGSYNHVFNELPNAPNQFNIEIIEGTKFCWVKTPKYDPKSILRFWSFMVFAIKVYFLPIRLIGKPDIIVVSSMPIFPVLSGYWLKLRYKAKAFIFEIRDIWPLTLILLGGVSKNHPAARLIGWFEKFGYRKAEKVVSLLPNAKSHIEEIAKAGSKFVYIPNGLDDGVLNKELAPLEYLEQIPTDRFVIGYTGTLGLANALEYFVEAAGFLKDDPRFFFVIVGDGYLKEELMNQSKEFGNILFFPKVRKNQVASFLQKFDLCFVGRNDTPLFKHGVSANKYFDYMLSSKPILDSNNYIKDPVELSGCGLIVKPDSADTIREGIIRMHSLGSEELMLMGQKGKEFVKEFHNITFLSNEYVKLFQNYLKQ